MDVFSNLCRLKTQKGGFLNADIKWNFTKWLISKDGTVVGRCVQFAAYTQWSHSLSTPLNTDTLCCQQAFCCLMFASLSNSMHGFAQ